MLGGDSQISSSRLETTTAKPRNRIKELWVKNKGSFRTAKLFSQLAVPYFQIDC
jgi:hypothetical protein